MTKQPPKQRRLRSWSVYLIKGTPARFVGLVHDAPDEKTAIVRAIKEYEVPSNQHDRLAARRQD
jgi:hypothetical protein